MRNVVVADLRAIGKSLGVRSCEFVRAVHLEIGEWTADEDLVTPNKRLHRDALRARYANEVENLLLHLCSLSPLLVTSKSAATATGRRTVR
jgi:long-subunit acyl-CoA synthetase (AMP-forming)